MKYRLHKFFARKVYNADTTIVIDINIQDVISNIIIGWEGSNTVDTMLFHPVRCIKKIEIVDGSDVLFSLNGSQAEALDWYNRGGSFRANHNWCLATSDCKRFIGINFGRYLYDKEYGFDPQRFNNPQLRITLDIDAGGNSYDENAITCFANIFDEAVPNLKGFFMAKEIKQFTVVAAAHEYTDLPLDYPYRGLYLQSYYPGTESPQCFNNIKLSEDQDKRIPFDHTPMELLRNLQEVYPLVEEIYWVAVGVGPSYTYIAPTTGVNGFATRWHSEAAVINIAIYDGDGGKLLTDSHELAANVQLLVKGYIPHGVFEIPFGIKNDPTDWYDVRGIGSLKLDVTGGAGGQGHIFLQQVRNY